MFVAEVVNLEVDGLYYDISFFI
ncbi:MAG: hypothetical protein RL609_1776, partial [Bacteroidota bacterium]